MLSPSRTADGDAPPGLSVSHSVPMARGPHREVVCILGLPIDVIGMEQAVQRVISATKARQPCLVSTPNVNFLVEAQRNANFRRSVQGSDLVLADGSPVVWISRLLGAPLPERASGADLFEHLRFRQPKASKSKIRVFFFGGPPGAAESARDALGETGDACEGVGADGAGFGSIEDMSQDAVIERINAAEADFLVVSLGAVKGQEWLRRNRNRLSTPVMSHLGAVVNFVSGRVDRAPAWVRRLHLEWCFRIVQEPWLWRRYAEDAWSLGRLVFTRLLPYMVLSRIGRALESGGDASSRGQVLLAESPGASRLSLSGQVGRSELGPLRVALDRLREDRPVVVDCSRLEHIDLYALGLLVTRFGLDDAQAHAFVGCNWRVTRLIRWAGAGYLLRRSG